jgi:hypothetical protein
VVTRYLKLPLKKLGVLLKLSEKELTKVAFSQEENHWIQRCVEELVGGSGFGVTEFSWKNNVTYN